MRRLLVFTLLSFLSAVMILAEDTFQLPEIPGIQSGYESSTEINSLFHQREELDESINQSVGLWSSELESSLDSLLNEFANTSNLLMEDSYLGILYGYGKSIGQEMYSNWLEKIYLQILDGNLDFLSRKSYGELYEKDDSYYTVMDSIIRDRDELLESIESTTTKYEKILEDAYNKELEFKNSVKNTIDIIRMNLEETEIFYERDSSGNKIKDPITGSFIYNHSGKELELVINKMDTALKNNSDITGIAEELEQFFEIQSKNSMNYSEEWQNKIYRSYSNESNRLIPPLYYNNNTQEYDNNIFIIGIRNFANNPADLIQKIESNLLGDPNLKVDRIYHADMNAITINPELQWNTNPFLPYSGIGGTFSKDGENFKSYINHTLLCWAWKCLPWDVVRNEELIQVELNFTVKDLNAQKNQNYWKNISLQIKNEENNLNQDLIPSLKTWKERVSIVQNKFDTWNSNVSSHKKEINKKYNFELQKLSSPVGTSDSFQITNPINLREIISKESNDLDIDSSILSQNNELNFQLLNSLNGIRDYSIFSAMNETIINSRKQYMESLRDQYSREKVLTQATPENILKEFQDTGICSKDNFKSNEAVCTGYIETHGQNKYKSVELDSNLNLVFKQNIFTGNYYLNNNDTSLFSSYVKEEKEYTFSVISSSNISLSESEINLFSNSKNYNLSTELSNLYHNISGMYKSSLVQRVENISSKISEISEKNLDIALSKISDSMEKAHLVKDLVETVLMGGSWKQWLKSVAESKVAEFMGEALNLDKNLILAYYNHFSNTKNLKKIENNYTFGFIPKSIAIPLATFSSNYIAESYGFHAKYITELSRVYYGDKVANKWSEDFKNKQKSFRMKEYEAALGKLDYNSQYRNTIKEEIYKKSIQSFYNVSPEEAEKLTQVFRYLENQKIQKELDAEKRNQNLKTSVQILTSLITSIVIPPLGLEKISATILTYLSSAILQAGIDSRSGNDKKTGSTFLSAILAMATQSKLLSISGTGIGINLSYENEKSPTTLSELIDSTIAIDNPKSSTGWSAGLIMGKNGFYKGIQYKDGKIQGSVGGENNIGFYDLNLSHNNIGLTLGSGSKFGTAMGLTLNSLLPSSIFASYNPDSNNLFGLGSSIQISQDGSISTGFDISKVEAISSQSSSQGIWSDPTLSQNYQEEQVNNFVQDTKEDKDKSDNLPNIPLSIYTLLAALGLLKRRKENIEIPKKSENQEKQPETILPQPDSEIPNNKDESPFNPEQINQIFNSGFNPALLAGIDTLMSSNLKRKDKEALLKALLGNLDIPPSDPPIEKKDTEKEIKNPDFIKSKEYKDTLKKAREAINGKGSVSQIVLGYRGSDVEKNSLKEEVFKSILETAKTENLESYYYNKFYEPIFPQLKDKLLTSKYSNLTNLGISDSAKNFLFDFRQSSAGNFSTAALAYQNASTQLLSSSDFKKLSTLKDKNGNPIVTNQIINLLENYSKGSNSPINSNGNYFYTQAQSMACRVLSMYGAICSVLQKSGSKTIPDFANYLSKGIENKIFVPSKNHLDSLGEGQYREIAGIFNVKAEHISMPDKTEHLKTDVQPDIPGPEQYKKALQIGYPVIMVRNGNNSHTYFAELSKDKSNYIVINTTGSPKSGEPVPANDIYYITGLKI